MKSLNGHEFPLKVWNGVILKSSLLKNEEVKLLASPYLDDRFNTIYPWLCHDGDNKYRFLEKIGLTELKVKKKSHLKASHFMYELD